MNTPPHPSPSTSRPQWAGTRGEVFVTVIARVTRVEMGVSPKHSDRICRGADGDSVMMLSLRRAPVKPPPAEKGVREEEEEEEAGPCAVASAVATVPK